MKLKINVKGHYKPKFPNVKTKGKHVSGFVCALTQFKS